MVYKTLPNKSAEAIKHFNDLNKPAFTLDEAYLLLKTSTKDAVKCAELIYLLADRIK